MSLFKLPHTYLDCSRKGSRAKHADDGGEPAKPFLVGPVDSGIWPTAPLPVGETPRSRAAAQVVPSTPVTPATQK